MAEVKVTDLRQNLPEYLMRVRGGERTTVASRGRPIAELGPPSPRDHKATSTTKARQYGFHDVVDSEEMFVRLLRRFREERIVP